MGPKQILTFASHLERWASHPKKITFAKCAIYGSGSLNNVACVDAFREEDVSLGPTDKLHSNSVSA